MKTKVLFLTGLMMMSVHSAFAKKNTGCASHIRFIHGEAFRDEAISVKVNKRTVIDELAFRGVSQYQTFKPGHMLVEILDTKTGVVLESKEFTAGSNIGYTVVFAGPAQGPSGMRFGNSSPFVLIDDITPVSNPSRWKGTWFRMSETNVVIDFRISMANDFANEVHRLRKKENRSSYQIGDLPAGTYSFHPVMIDASEPFFNTALEPAKTVEVKGLSIQGGENVDIIALGNFLGKAPNSLDLTYSKYTPSLNERGCIEIAY